MMDLVGQNMTSCISAPSLALKGWYKDFIDENPEDKIDTFTDHMFVGLFDRLLEVVEYMQQ
jgi:hypothetical protein